MTPARHAPDPARYTAFVPAVPGVPPVPRRQRRWRWRHWEVRIEQLGDADAPAQMLLLHGAGGNADAMRPLAERIAARGILVTTIDLPGYGQSRLVRALHRRVPALRYEHWRALAADLLRELDDGRPLVAAGASIGGMLALEAAALSGMPGAVLASCLLDVRDPAALRAMLRWPWLRALVPLLGACRGPLARVPLPLRWLTGMRLIANDPRLTAVVLADRQGGGGAMPLSWYRSFLRARRVVRPADARVPHVVLAHPAEDRWTAPELSERALARFAPDGELVLLEGAGHFPVEEPGLGQFADAAARAAQLAASAGARGTAP